MILNGKNEADYHLPLTALLVADDTTVRPFDGALALGELLERAGGKVGDTLEAALAHFGLGSGASLFKNVSNKFSSWKHCQQLNLPGVLTCLILFDLVLYAVRRLYVTLL